MNNQDLSNALTGTAYNRIVQLRDEIKQSIADKGLTASGRTQNSLRVYVDGNTVVLEGRAFFASLEYGSSEWSGKTGIHCSYEEFKSIIYQWATDKGLNFGEAKDFKKAVANIAWVIMNQGTKLYWAHGYRDVYDTLVEKAVEDIGNQALLVEVEAVDVVINQWART